MLLAAVLLAMLSACGSRNPAALTQTVWEDPTPEIRGSIENGVYTNNWLNLARDTSSNPAFLEEYNRISCMADPQRNRWCELYEYDENGNRLILTVEQLPQNTAFGQTAQAYAESFRNKLKGTKDGVTITVEAEKTDTDYTFREYTCTLYQFQITSRYEGTQIEQKTAELFFWEKDGYLIELQVVDTVSNCLNDLFPSDEEPEPSQTGSSHDNANTPENNDSPSGSTPSDIPATAPMSEVPYTTSISGSTPIYAQPDSNSSFVQNVGQDGIYTIVEEAYDSKGNLWGKLKSGLGWVNLVPAEEKQASQNPITAKFADSNLRGDYHKVVVDDSEYMVKVVFSANEKLSNVQFTSLTFADDGYAVSEVYQTLPELTPGKPLVACVSFPGIMSVYGISFTDSSGNYRSFAVSTSGRDGSLVFEEY